MNKNIKIMLQKEASGNNYSVECGLADNVKQFDHHKPEHRHFKCPANNDQIPIINNGIIEISHIDADTFLGICRLLGYIVPKNLNLDLLEKIDLNGSSVLSDKNNYTYFYMLGVGVMARSLNFPQCDNNSQDVTKYITNMLNVDPSHFVNLGENACKRSEFVYKDTMVYSGESFQYGTKLAFFVIGADQPLDPSRAYEDGYGIVVVYRKHYKTISIYCNPNNELSFAGSSFSIMDGTMNRPSDSSLNCCISFNGHPKACGSDRGVSYNLLHATLLVFNQLL